MRERYSSTLSVPPDLIMLWRTRRALKTTSTLGSRIRGARAAHRSEMGPSGTCVDAMIGLRATYVVSPGRNEHLAKAVEHSLEVLVARTARR